MITLKIYIDGEFKQKIDLMRDVETIGRSRSATLRLTDPKISGSHAQIKRTDKGVVIMDMGSSNGTFVNEKKITTHVLKIKDKIRMGNVGFKVKAIHDMTLVGDITEDIIPDETEVLPSAE